VLEPKCHHDVPTCEICGECLKEQEFIRTLA
jgi:hypothetical protein